MVDRDGTRLVTSETGPPVRRYTGDGKVARRLPIPNALRVTPAGRAASDLTFEGLTLRLDGRTLVASMEGALSGDNRDLVRSQT